MDASRVLHALLPRQSQDSTGNAFLDTIQSQAENQTKIGGRAVVSSLILALSVGGALTVLFCFIRPHNNIVYAPRAKYADSRHAPPPVTKGFFSWVTPLFKTKEPELVDRLGLDAAVFLRVYRMMRNMFVILAVIGCAIIIPVNVIAAKKSGWFDKMSADGDERALQMLNIMTPQYLYSSPSLAWAFVVVAWLMSAIILSFLWWNYRAVARLRRQYFDSQEYRSSLHSRTLLITDIPKELRTDDGIVRITEETRASTEVPRAAIARNVKDLPELVEEHEDAVKKLEKVLAKYLKNPDKLPLNRPLCKPSSKDKSYSKGQKVDAIDYLTSRIKQLEIEIGHVRESIDKRNALPFGFASYQEISEAHIVAYATRKKAPRGSEIRLAPRPNDLIWRNLKMLRAERKWQNFINGLWIALLTVFYIVPNILIAVFLSNLGNLGNFWPAFQRSLDANQTFWGVVQGVLAPAISFLIYLFLPMIFRKLRINAGDLSKTSRERHVTSALYSFFVFNQFVVISFFSVAWGYIALIIKHKDLTKDNLGATIVTQLSTMSPYWVSWMIQRNMGASIDLIQLLRLTYGSFQRRFMSPTPREQIEASAPQPFDYASYYNVILFYSTVAFVLAPIQPLVLLIAAANFCFDSYVKKYMLLYIFITKYESGGMFWRTIFNRVLVLTVLGNLMIAIIIVSMGFFQANWPKLAALAPVFLVIIAFKFYCVSAFDDKIHFYQQGKSLMDSDFEAGGEHKHSARRDKVSVRFGNPVLYKPLITPMVSAKSQHLLKNIYSGRTSLDMNPAHTGGYSDVYMDPMDARHPGKGAKIPNAPFEIVNENEMDFEHFKNRAEFREAAGGDGQLFGHGADMIRPGTPSSIGTGFTRTGTMDSLTFAKGGPGGHLRGESDSSSVAGGPRYPAGGPYSHVRNDSRASSSSRGSDATRVAPGFGPHAAVDGHEYPRGYHQTPSALREQSPAGSDFGGAASRSGSRGFAPELGRQQSQDPLVMRAAAMGRSDLPAPTPLGPNGGYGPIRYGGVPADSPGQTPPGAVGDETSYDYFRRGRSGLR